MATRRMNRIPAKDPGARIGYAINNPGGPGDLATGNIFAYGAGFDYIQPKILKHFDVSKAFHHHLTNRF